MSLPEIDPTDIRYDVFSNSATRHTVATHLPSGFIAESDNRSQMLAQRECTQKLQEKLARRGE